MPAKKKSVIDWSQPVLITKRELSSFFGLSTRQLERWQEEGLPVIKKGKENRYNLLDVFEWRQAKIKDKNMTELDLEKIRETKAKADIKELEALEKGGNLLPLDLILIAWQSIISSTKAAFRGVSSDVKIYKPSIENEVLDFIKKRINEILQGLADENPVPAKLRKVAEEYQEDFYSTTGPDA